MSKLYKLIKFFYDAFLSIYLFGNIKLFFNNHLTIGLQELKNKRVFFPHPIGIVIGRKVKIGYDCTIYQNVTIGTNDFKEEFINAKYPHIGNSVTICAGSVIFGDITIGDHCIIGAGSIVRTSFPENSVIAGNPAKLIKNNI